MSFKEKAGQAAGTFVNTLPLLSLGGTGLTEEEMADLNLQMQGTGGNVKRRLLDLGAVPSSRDLELISGRTVNIDDSGFGGALFPHVKLVGTTTDPNASDPNFQQEDIDKTKQESLGRVPELQHFTGNTDVGLTPDQLESLDIIGRINRGDLGSLQQELYGPLERTVLGPARQSLRDQVLPGLDEVFSGGATGSQFNTGARRSAQERSLTEFGEASARLRAEAPGRKLAELAGTFGIQDTERQNDVDNMNRQLQVHYQNQGLSQAEFQMQMAAIDSALSESNFDWLRYTQDRQMDQTDRSQDFEEKTYYAALEAQRQAIKDSEKAGLFGTLGTIAGGGLGFLLGGPLGAAAGSTIGGGAGLSLGGAPQLGMQGLQSGIGSLLLPQLLNSNPYSGGSSTLLGTGLDPGTRGALDQGLGDIQLNSPQALDPAVFGRF